MKDPRLEQLADILTSHSTNLQPGEKVLIEAIDIPHALTHALVAKATERQALPFVTLRSNEITRSLVKSISPEAMRSWGEYDMHRMQDMDAYIGVRGSFNISEMVDMPEEKMNSYKASYLKPVSYTHLTLPTSG